MKTIHILSDEEVAGFKAMSRRIEQLENENKTLREFNSNKRSQIESLNKQLATKAHELLVKEAELASMSSDFRTATKCCEASEVVAKRRLEIMNNLEKSLFSLKRERYAVVRNPRNGRIVVASMRKVDIYRKFGWEVLAEDILADIPA